VENKPTIKAENTYKVFDWLWTSGQLTEEDIHHLPELGIEVVFNLGLPTSIKALANEAALVTELGITYIQIPVVWKYPKPDQFTQFAGLLQLYSGHKIWAHCAKNMRVSVFVYLYRLLVLRESEEEASFPLREIWQPDEVWQQFIHSEISSWVD
jgi:protein tyrosine phosphatase (PTP) superfamily phosphohydrolase (DUF442 family)